jgi:hypothetical protein
MGEKNWSRVGPVTVKDYLGHTYNFGTLDEAVRHVGKFRIENLKRGKLGFPTKSPFNLFKQWVDGDSHIFLDELGLIIPIWRVQEVYRNLPNRFVASGRMNWRRRCSFHQFRDPRTQQELREGPTRASRNRLPSSWDDIHIAARENRNWKQFRSTQWKIRRD